MSRKGVAAVLKRRTVFTDHGSKVAAIISGEYGLTKAILDAGYTIDTLQLAYQGVDWRDKRNWKCNGGKHPSRESTYLGISLNPLEDIFHKTFWKGEGTVMKDFSDRYMKWADLTREGKSAASVL